MRELRKVQMPFSVSRVSRAAVLAVAENYDRVKARALETASMRRELERGLTSLGLRVFDSHANFVLFHPGDDRDRFFQGLCDRGILIRKPSGSPTLDTMLRVSVGTEPQNRLFLDSMKDLVSSG